MVSGLPTRYLGLIIIAASTMLIMMSAARPFKALDEPNQPNLGNQAAMGVRGSCGLTVWRKIGQEICLPCLSIMRIHICALLEAVVGVDYRQEVSDAKRQKGAYTNRTIIARHFGCILWREI